MSYLSRLSGVTQIDYKHDGEKLRHSYLRREKIFQIDFA